jgi:hypothetical protein
MKIGTSRGHKILMIDSFGSIPSNLVNTVPDGQVTQVYEGTNYHVLV